MGKLEAEMKEFPKYLQKTQHAKPALSSAGLPRELGLGKNGRKAQTDGSKLTSVKIGVVGAVEGLRD